MGGGRFPPLEVIKSWPKPNYVDPETHGWEIPILCTVLFVLAFVVVSLRLYARFFMLKSAGIDDYLILASMVPLLGLCITLSLASKVYNFDRHVWDVPRAEIKATRKIVIPIEVLYCLTTGLTKLSILFFYRRLSERTVTSTLRYIAWASIAFVGIFTVFHTIFPLLQCVPLHAFWNQVDPAWYKVNQGAYKCINERTNLITHGIMSVIQDFLACGLPIVIFFKLQLPLRQKVLLSGIFALGFTLCIFGVLRIEAIRYVYSDTYDTTWAAHSIWVWTAVEATLATVVASLPSCRVYISKFLLPTLRSWQESGSGGNGSWKPSFVHRSQGYEGSGDGRKSAGLWGRGKGDAVVELRETWEGRNGVQGWNESGESERDRSAKYRL